MSFLRLIYFSAVIGGWSAFVGWIPAEALIVGTWQDHPIREAAFTAMIVGGCLGIGLSALAAVAAGQWPRFPRLLSGGLLGGLGGLLGGGLGGVLYSQLGLPREVGWMLMGCCIGMVEGVHERAFQKFRNGLIGGALGGLLGGLAFRLITNALGSSSSLASRAIAFALLGAMVGLLIGFVQVALRSAWLTVVDGFRPGRQYILSGPVQLGRSDQLPLPLLGSTSQDVAQFHAEILVDAAAGVFRIRDLGTSVGTFLNGSRLQQPAALSDGDAIRIGGNILRFNQKAGDSAPAADDTMTNPLSGSTSAPPPPPPPPGGRLRQNQPSNSSNVDVDRQPAKRGPASSVVPRPSANSVKVGSGEQRVVQPSAPPLGSVSASPPASAPGVPTSSTPPPPPPAPRKRPADATRPAAGTSATDETKKYPPPPPPGQTSAGPGTSGTPPPPPPPKKRT